MAGAAPGEVRAVICTYNSAGEVPEAIASCLAQGLGPEQLTVVDNASRDATVAVVRARFPAVRVIEAGRNLGFGAAVNLGAKGAGGSELLILNPDARLESGALAAMLEALGARVERGAISPRVLRPDGRLDPACRRSFPTPGVALWRLSGMSRLRPSSARFGAYNLTHLPADRGQEVDSGTGACLLVRRDLFDRVGGFDEGYFMYGEDLELCWQLWAQGARVWYEPRAVVWHRKGSSSERAALAMLVHFHRSMWRFYRLHYLRGRQAWLAPLVALGIGGRLVVLLLLNASRRRPRVSP